MNETLKRILEWLEQHEGYWNAAEIAGALQLTTAKVRELLRDGVRSGTVVEIAERGCKTQYCHKRHVDGAAGQSRPQPSASQEPDTRKPAANDLASQLLHAAKSAPTQTSRYGKYDDYMPAIQVLREEKRYTWPRISQWLKEHAGIEIPGYTLSPHYKRWAKAAGGK